MKKIRHSYFRNVYTVIKHHACCHRPTIRSYQNLLQLYFSLSNIFSYHQPPTLFPRPHHPASPPYTKHTNAFYQHSKSLAPCANPLCAKSIPILSQISPAKIEIRLIPFTLKQHAPGVSKKEPPAAARSSYYLANIFLV